jgi:hypothetical protein
MAYAYIERTYGLRFSPGDRVHHTVTKQNGTVKRENPSVGHYVMVAFDSKKFAVPCHPGELEKLP